MGFFLFIFPRNSEFVGLVLNRNLRGFPSFFSLIRNFQFMGFFSLFIFPRNLEFLGLVLIRNFCFVGSFFNGNYWDFSDDF